MLTELKTVNVVVVTPPATTVTFAVPELAVTRIVPGAVATPATFFSPCVTATPAAVAFTLPKLKSTSEWPDLLHSRALTEVTTILPDRSVVMLLSASTDVANWSRKLSILFRNVALMPGGVTLLVNGPVFA